MSSYEIHKGILKEVDLEGKTPKEFLSSDIDDIFEFIYNNNLHEKYLYVNDKLYEWLYHNEEFDRGSDFCQIIPNPDGSLNIFTQFYNGGTDIVEVLEDELKNIDLHKFPIDEEKLEKLANEEAENYSLEFSKCNTACQINRENGFYDGFKAGYKKALGD